MIGRLLEDRYLIEGALDAGGMGIVYRAHDVRLGRRVAVKFGRSSADAQAGATAQALTQEVLLEEAQTVSALEHPSIVPVYALGHTPEGEVFVVMRLVDGRTLASLIEGRLGGHDRTAEAALGSLRQIAILERIGEALACAHARGVLHADLKPANVMIGAFGEVQVMDWGLAAVVRRIAPAATASGQEEVEARKTTRGAIYGTPSYMAPEQAGAGGAVDARTDVFGIGAVGYHMATGNPPYHGATVEELLARARAGRRNDPDGREAAWRFERDLLAVLNKAMAADPRHRYQDVAQFLRDLSALRSSRPLLARHDGPIRRMHKLVRRRPAAATGLAAMSLLAVAGLWGIGVRQRNSELEYRQETARLADELEAIDAAAEGDSSLSLLPSQPGTDGPRTRSIQDPESATARSKRIVFDVASRRLIDLLRAHRVDFAVPLAAADASDLLAAVGTDRAAQLVRMVYSLYRFLYLDGIPHVPDGQADAHVAALVAAWNAIPDWLAAWGQRAGVTALQAHRTWLETGNMDVASLLVLTEPSRQASAEELLFLGFVLSDAAGAEVATKVLRTAARTFPAIANVRKRLCMHLTNLAMMAPGSPSGPGPDSVALLDAAIAHGTAAVALTPRSTWALANLGVAFELRAQAAATVATERNAYLEEAAHSFAAALAIEQDHVSALVGSANVLLSRDEPKKALEFLARARAVAPDDFAVHHLMGLAYDRIVQGSMLFGPVKEAIASFRKVTELQPGWWEGHLRLGMALQSDGQHEAAIASFHKGLEIYPKSIDLRVFEAESLWETGKHEQAMDTLLAVLRDHPGQENATGLYRDYLDELPTEDLRKRYQGLLR